MTRPSDSAQIPPEQSSNSLRFVLLWHKVSLAYAKQTGRSSHFDLLLQLRQGEPEEAILEAWAMDQNPFDHPGQQAVIRLRDHRGHYLDYEGQISGNRGSVRRIAWGEITWHRRNAVDRSLKIEGFCQNLSRVGGRGLPQSASASSTVSLRLEGGIQIARQSTPSWQLEYISTETRP